MASAWEMKGRLEKATHGDISSGGHRRKVSCLRFNHSGSHLATGATDGSIRIHATVSTPQGLLTLSSSSASTVDFRGHDKGLSALGWNPTSETQFGSCGYDRTVRLWDARHKVEEGGREGEREGGRGMEQE
ncbi:wd repeat-containing protein [Nannochloropsis gaditana]|uniref:Wd repeat-containing protein n=1 Tax=Nannochloropsis gaditana TaxID=72520 RepID=W7TB07_9STRA|nr:wd repeat-containing protein [Nannochloropsis gaditana]